MKSTGKITTQLGGRIGAEIGPWLLGVLGVFGLAMAFVGVLWPYVFQSSSEWHSYIPVRLLDGRTKKGFNTTYITPRMVENNGATQVGLTIDNSWAITRTIPRAHVISATATGDEYCKVAPPNTISRSVPPPNGSTSYWWDVTAKGWFGQCTITYDVDFAGAHDVQRQHVANIVILPLSGLATLGGLIISILGLGIFPALINRDAAIKAAKIKSSEYHT
jgi:hypothetical protein